jgi:hypothetical protein
MSTHRATGQITELALHHDDADTLQTLMLAIHTKEKILRIYAPESDTDYCTGTALQSFRRLQEVTDKYQRGLSLPATVLQQWLRMLSNPDILWNDAAWEILDIAHELGLKEIFRRASIKVMELDRAEIRTKRKNWKPEDRFSLQMYRTLPYLQLQLLNRVQMAIRTTFLSGYGDQSELDREDHRLGNCKLALL